MLKSEFLTHSDRLATEEWQFQIPNRKEYLLAQMGKGKRILDVGCLSGKLSRLMMDQNNEVWGIEVNPAAAELAQRRGVRVKVVDVEQEGFPFESASFDVVHAGEFLEYLYDTKLFFEEARRVLKPGGLLLLTAPNLNSWENRIRVASGGFATGLGAYLEDHFGSHVRVFNLAKLKELCFETDFEIRDVAGVAALDARGWWWDMPMGLVGRCFPSFSKLILITAQKV
jgi:SAM-dependent methyltransferase